MTEDEIAEYEACRNDAADTYFGARPQLLRTREQELLFEAGFEKAYSPESQALKARVADLEVAIKIFKSELMQADEPSEIRGAMYALNDAFNKSPKQSLAELRYNILSEAASHIGSGAWCEELENYAQQRLKGSE